MSKITPKDLQTKDLLVAIDLETTGLDPHLHDIWEIAIIPFKNYEPLPCTFKARIRPSNPMTIQDEALKIGNVTKKTLINIPTNLYQVLSSFYNWKLEMYPEYRFVPVGHNYAAFDKQFLIAKMNYYNYDQNFSHHCLDTKIIGRWLKSLGYDLSEKLSLNNFKEKFNIQQKSHCAEGDALACIELLKKFKELING
mgnify:CR=1 FL=1